MAETGEISINMTDSEISVDATPLPSMCELCGSADAVNFAGRQLCVDCIQISGSCCAEQDDGDGC